MYYYSVINTSVITDMRISDQEFRLYCLIMGHIRIDGTANMSADYLATQLNCRNEAIVKRINALKNYGLIEVAKNDNDYTFSIPQTQSAQPLVDVSLTKTIEKDVSVNKPTETLEERKQKFIEKVDKALEEYPEAKIVRDSFISYWTEHNENGKKMRFELEKVFSIKARLTRFMINKKKIQPQYLLPEKRLYTYQEILDKIDSFTTEERRKFFQKANLVDREKGLWRILDEA